MVVEPEEAVPRHSPEPCEVTLIVSGVESVERNTNEPSAPEPDMSSRVP